MNKQIDSKYLDHMLIVVKRATENVRQILNFSRHTVSEKGTVHLCDIAREGLRMMKASLPSSIELELNFDADIDTIWANPLEMHQVIMNLCTNTFYAMKVKGGRLRIHISKHKGALLGWSLFTGILPDEMIKLTVSDTETGIAQEIIPKIFEPFFTTKKQEEGTGIGLALVHGIVTRSNDIISVESILGEGTSLHVYMPIYSGKDSMPEEKEVCEVARKVSDRKIKALFIDDEYLITRMAKEILPVYGIDVECENNSSNAKLIIENRIDEYDVLITDQVMPTYSGIDLARHALNLRPSLPVIICTGYSDSISVECAREIGVKKYMIKPPDYHAMARLIKGWMD